MIKVKKQMTIEERILEMVKTVRALPSRELVPVKRRVSIGTQRELFEIREASKSNGLRAGDFYEVLTKAFYGGELKTQISLPNGGTAKPDIIDDDKKIFIDSKGTSTSHACILRDEQLELYKRLLELYPNYSLYFALYKHGIAAIKSEWKGDHDELVSRLTEDTIYSIVLPFSLVIELNKPKSETRGLVYRYGGETLYGKCTCLRPMSTIRLLAEPEELLERLRLDPKRFNYERFLSPNEFKVNDRTLRQFPILRISER